MVDDKCTVYKYCLYSLMYCKRCYFISNVSIFVKSNVIVSQIVLCLDFVILVAFISIMTVGQATLSADLIYQTHSVLNTDD